MAQSELTILLIPRLLRMRIDVQRRTNRQYLSGWFALDAPTGAGELDLLRGKSRFTHH